MGTVEHADLGGQGSTASFDAAEWEGQPYGAEQWTDGHACKDDASSAHAEAEDAAC